MDFKNERTYKKLIEENFHKPKQNNIDEESKEGEDGGALGIALDGSTRETTAVSSKKTPEML